MPHPLAHLHPVATRGLHIGGSDIAGICGISPWSSPLDVYRSITEGRDYAAGDQRKKWGRRLERVIADAYGEDNGVEVEWVDQTYARPDRPWQTATPDFLIDPWHDPKGGDAKNVALDRAWTFGEPGTDDVPLYYATQMMWYCDVLDLPEWIIATLFGGSAVSSYPIRASEEMAAILREEAEKFIQDHIMPGRPPLASGTAATASWIRRKHPDHPLGMRRATGPETALCRAYWQAHAEFKQAERAKDAIEQQIQICIGEHEGLFLPDGNTATWRNVHRDGYAVKPTTFRRFDCQDKSREEKTTAA